MHLTRKYALGLIFILAVALIWAASSVLIQYIYSSDAFSFHSPFLVTYIGVSLFTLWLPTQKLLACIKSKGFCTGAGISRIIPRDGDDDLSSSGRGVSYRDIPAEHPSEIQSDDEGDREENGIIISAENGLSHPDEHHLLRHSSNGSLLIPWTETDHLRAAIRIAPVWFIANWTYNASLAYTSITSSTVLASTGSLFTFLFAVLSHDEHFNWTKFAGVFLGVTGSIITAFHDVDSSDNNDDNPRYRILLGDNDCADNNNNCGHAVFGDFLGLISAVGYGTYAVQTRVLCPHNESLYSMQTLLGYIGLLNLVLLSPIALYQLLSGKVELAAIVVGFLIVKGLFDNVLSDYLWLRAVMLTNATVATVGLGLTIPLAFASDIVLGKGQVTGFSQVFGAIAVLAGFVLVNVGNNDDDDGNDNEIIIEQPTDESEQGQEVVILPGRTLT